MKRYSIIALLTILSSYIYAQDVWTEGTTWDVEYIQESNIPHTLFTLMKAMDIEGVPYHPLTASTDEGCDTIAYIRSEHGDSLVFARVICNGILLPESLLYDFSKSFKYGDILQYATTEGTFTECISYEEDPITYLYDIFEEGDRIPMWKGIIYKIGHIEGPLGLFFVEPIEGPSTIKPKPTNVSHILFGTKKNDSKVLYSKSVTNSINRTSPVINTPVIYNLCGIRLYSVSKRGLYIIDGKKVMK